MEKWDVEVGMTNTECRLKNKTNKTKSEVKSQNSIS